MRALAACVALAMTLGAVAPIVSPVTDIAFAAKKAASETKAKATKAKTRQWTGTIVELAEGSLTVTKGKKKPKKMTFTRSSKTRVQGDLEEGSRVTVYYRTNGNKAEAHRIVVKES
jgi:hypothetical protein